MQYAQITQHYVKNYFMKNKVALLLFGHMRTYEECFQNLKMNLIDSLNPDIFIHTWDEIESTTTSWHKANMDNYIISNNEKKHIHGLYHPKKIEFENQKKLANDSELLINGMSVEGQKFMMYSLFKANEMKKKYEAANNITYDIVIKLRPDVLLKEPIMNFCKNDQYNDNEVLLCGNKVKFGNKLASYRALDVISISNSKTMDLVAGIYNKSHDYLSRELYKHSTFIDYLIEHDIDINISKYNYQKKWIIKRSV
jgi:hypothetical protein